MSDQPTVWKYTIDLRTAYGRVPLEMRRGAMPLHVAVDPDNLTQLLMWAFVPDPNAPTEVRSFEVVGTGDALSTDDADYSYAGTAFERYMAGLGVWHVFEVTPHRRAQEAV